MTHFGPIEIEKALYLDGTEGLGRAPRLMKMGTTALPWRYDAAARRCDPAGWPATDCDFTLRLMGGRLPNFAGPAPDAPASALKLPPPKIIFWAATPAPGLRPLD